MDLKEKTVLITGGASGMGAATAQWLAKQGMRVAILDREPGVSVQADVVDSNSVATAVEKVIAQFGPIHACIQCAGIAPAARIVGKNGPMPLEDFQKVIQINLVGTFNVMRIIAAKMIQQPVINSDGERGVIINTASIAAFEGQIGQAAYSASKAGVIGMTLPAAREFSQFGIRVMVIAPGIIATPMIDKMSDEVTQNLIAAVPFPKRLGNPIEYAKVAQQIIENPYLNGSVIRLDGSMRMGSK